MKSKELQEKVINAYLKNMSLKEIITTFKVSETNIYDILNRYDIPRRRFNKEKNNE